MNNDDRLLLNKLLQEISELRGEMKEFKEQTIYRLNTCEKKCEERQLDPDKCAAGMFMKEHITANGKKKEAGRSGIMLLLEGGMLLSMILIAVFK